MAKINPDLLKALDKDVENAVEMLPGTSMNGGLVRDNPKIRAIVDFLIENPLYVEPTLRFLNRTHSAVAAATLETLYTPEELAAMRKEHGIK